MQLEHIKVVSYIIVAYEIHILIVYHYKVQGESNHSNVLDFLTMLHKKTWHLSLLVNVFCVVNVIILFCFSTYV